MLNQLTSSYNNNLQEVKRICKRAYDIDGCDECNIEIVSKRLKPNSLIIVHANLKGIQTNTEFANKTSMKSNVSLFTECLADTQIKFKNSIYVPGKKIFSKNATRSKKLGRCSGGILFVVDNDINATCKFHTRRTGTLIINKLVIIGTYLPSFDNKPHTELALKKELSIVEQLYKKYSCNGFDVIILGDLNIDLNRKYKRAEILQQFLQNNMMTIQEQQFKQELDHSYFFSKPNPQTPENQSNRIYIKSTIDYTISKITNKNFSYVTRYNDNCNVGDHHPTRIEYNLIPTNVGKPMFNITKKRKPNWTDAEFVLNYRKRVVSGCKNIMNDLEYAHENHTSRQKVSQSCNNINLKLQELILSSSENAKKELYSTGRTKKRKFYGKPKKWWNDQLGICFNIVIRKLKAYNNNEDSLIHNQLKQELLIAKKNFRIQKRFNLKLLRDSNLRSIDEAFKLNRNNFWKKMKSLNRDSQDIEAELDKIKDEFKKIFTVRNQINEKFEKKMSTIVNKFIDETFSNIENMKVEPNLIKQYIADLPTGKSTGTSGISNEMLKASNGDELATVIASMYSLMINFGVTPVNFNTSILKPLIKNKSKPTNDTSNLRPVAISDILSNTLERVLLMYIEINYTDHAKQFGFKRNSSCSHALFVLKTAINVAKLQKKRLYAVAIDASKAFDKVNRMYIWAKLIEWKINPAIIRLLMIYYEASEIIVQLGNEKSKAFKSTVGVKQGGVLSPRLFSIYMDELILKISQARLGIRVGRLSLDIIGYADDVLIISNIKKNIQTMLNIVDDYSNEHEIKVNGDKTVLIVFNKWLIRNKNELEKDVDNSDLKLQGIVLVETHYLKYLGVELSSALSNTKHIESRVNKIHKAFALIKTNGLNDVQVHACTKGQLFKSFIMPNTTYGLDLMSLNKKEFNLMRIAECNVIKSMINVTSGCHSKSIFHALKIETLQSRIEKSKLSLYIRLCKNEYTAAILDQLKINGLKTTFVEEIESFTKDYSSNWNMEKKCELELEVMKSSNVADQENNKIADELKKIFNGSIRTKIPFLVTKLTIAYQVNLVKI